MLQITALYASILSLIIIFLCFKVVTFRRSKKVEIGDAGDASGIRYIRAQQNAVEYVPIVLVLMAVYEANGGSMWTLHAVGLILVFARIIHPIGLIGKKGVSFGRFYGTALTWACIIALAGLNIFKYMIGLL